MYSHKREESYKGNKRERPEYGSSPEDENRIFQKSKVLTRTPPEKVETDKQINRGEMEDIVKLLEQMREDIKDIKSKVTNNCEEVKSMREEIISMQENWNKERKELKNELYETKEEVESLKREKIRNNLVITGITVETEDMNQINNQIGKILENEMNIKVTPRKAFKIKENIWKLEMNTWEEKMLVLKEKGKLKGKKIYIDPELTYNERGIQKKLRDIAKSERARGAKVKVKFQKIEINGQLWKWSKLENRLEKTTESDIRIEAKN